MDVLTYTPKEASKALSVSVATVYRWMDDGTLPVVQMGKRRMIHAERLRQKLDANCAATQTNHAPGVVQGEAPCPTNVKVHRIGGHTYPRREAVRRLDALLGR
ncbi:helix-turn-helix domain-containing protein [Halomonas citrativorans]|uniref:Helix-turn-helix domain-containing protein n=1 Tax=Halomonas citrativorans TaxID=2742612 RepID=A0ABR9FAS8_9GAMM|nr:helix-turn-helix domain-containing protein [Halomonas citrativorans]MBE0403101.1 helix-turn-helix domain-containing protein [Halomonas citrativorans]